MTPHPLGQTGLAVSPIGFRAMHFDGIDDEAEVGRLLNGLLDLGITLIVQRGPLAPEVRATLDDAWGRHGRDWPGIV